MGDSGDLDEEDRDMLLRMINRLGKEVGDLKKMMYLIMQGRESDAMRVQDLDDYAPPVAPRSFPNTVEDEVYHPEVTFPIQPSASTQAPVKELPESLSLKKKQREFIVRALQKHNNNRKRAAEELGISERTLYRKLKTYEIDL